MILVKIWSKLLVKMVISADKESLTKPFNFILKKAKGNPTKEHNGGEPIAGKYVVKNWKATFQSIYKSS